jgi:hypothetical protein
MLTTGGLAVPAGPDDGVDGDVLERHPQLERVAVKAVEIRRRPVAH